MPNNKKYLSMLGMARKAGRLSMGHDMAVKSIKAHKARLLLFAGDVSPRLFDEFDVLTDRYYPELICLRLDETINAFHMALGYKAGVITVDDENFSKRIIELINQEENEYGN